jgi:hypothetical protein
MPVRLYSLFVIASFFVATECKADVIAASNFPMGQTSTNGWQEIGLIAPRYNNFNNSNWGQSFVATADGLLTTVDTLLAAGMEQRLSGSPPLSVSFHKSVAGLPVAKLGTVSYTANDFFSVFGSDDHRVMIDFTAFAIPIRTGEEYLVAYETPFGLPGTNGSHAPYFVGLVLDNPIPFGRTTSVARNGIDWEVTPPPTPPYTFELATRIWTTPEPTVGQLLIMAVAIALLRRWRDLA